MSQSKKVQKITVRNRPGAEGQLTVGANTQVLLDGVPIRGASFIKIEIGAKKMAKVNIELFAEVEIEANVELNPPKVKKIVGKTTQGKPLAIHTMTNYEPVAIVKKE
jgi:hypothetical protein